MVEKKDSRQKIKETTTSTVTEPSSKPKGSEKSKLGKHPPSAGTQELENGSKIVGDDDKGDATKPTKPPTNTKKRDKEKKPPKTTSAERMAKLRGKNKVIELETGDIPPPPGLNLSLNLINSCGWNEDQSVTIKELIEAGWATRNAEQRSSMCSKLMASTMNPQFKLLIEGQKLQNLEHLRGLTPSELLIVAMEMWKSDLDWVENEMISVGALIFETLPKCENIEEICLQCPPGLRDSLKFICSLVCDDWAHLKW